MRNGAEDSLLRAIGRRDLTALVINAVIGAGIFGLPGKVFALIGAYSALALVACGVLVFLLVVCFAEVGSRFRATGGPYLYAHAAFGPWTGFAVGWLAWLARTSSLAALTNLFVSYLGWFVPGVETGAARVLACTLVLLVLAGLNARGVRGATRVGNAFALGKLAPLLLFVAGGMLFVEPARLAPGPVPSLDDFSQAVLLLVYAYTGFESAIIPSGEMLDPGRDIAFALLVATVVVTAVYLGVQVVCIGTLPGLANSERPLADAAAHLAGSVGAATIAAGALVSIGGTLNANMLAAPRLLFAMAERAQMPAAIGRVHARFRTPHLAIAVTTAFTLAATLSGGFVVLVLISTIARLLVYGSTCAALLALRRKAQFPAPRFRAPGGVLVPVLALALCAWLLLHSTWQEAGFVALALGLGIVPYALLRVRSRRRGPG